MERLFTDIIEVTEQLIDEHKADAANPGQGKGRNASEDGQALKGSKNLKNLGETLAASHGEGTRPVRLGSFFLFPLRRGAMSMRAQN